MKKSVGRPPFHDGVERVPFNCMVKPATKSLIDSWPKSRGINLDRLVEAEDKRLRSKP